MAAGEHKPLLVGQAPGRHARYRPEFALFPYPPNCAGHKLMKLMGLTRYVYLDLFDRMNLVDEYPGQTASGDRVPMGAMVDAATKLFRGPALDGRHVLLVGRAVARAFDCGEQPPMRWWGREWWNDDGERECHVRFAWVYHPSGRNRWYNDPDNREDAEEFLRKFAGMTEARLI